MSGTTIKIDDTLYTYDSRDPAMPSGSGGTATLGGSGSQTLTGTDGRDLLVGGSGQDSLEGGAGNDILVGGTLQGNFGNANANKQIVGDGVKDTFAFNFTLNVTAGTTVDEIFHFDERTVTVGTMPGSFNDWARTYSQWLDSIRAKSS
jgi:Ca2+-binding RTX toxin-like protein